ncbi:MAG: alpha/beta fold hydrolase [Gemmatimonadetes bacterium]|nr:alpha/beta fold hydrolase [Gemmatimonadota bacterium]
MLGRGTSPVRAFGWVWVGMLVGCGGGDPEPISQGGAGQVSLPVHEPVSDTAGYVRVGDARLYYTAFGSGPPLLVVHGGPGLDQAYMRPWFDELQDVARVVYYDQRGTGGSTAPRTAAALHFDQFVGDIERIRQAMGWERFTLLGHSWGGILAVAYAREHGSRLAGMVLVSPAEPGTQFAALAAERSREARSAETQARLGELLASDGYAQGEPAVVSEIFKVVFATTLADSADIGLLDLELSETTARNREEVTGLLQQGMVQPEWWPELRSITVPTLVIHGRHDPLPIEMAEALADSLPGGRLVRLRDSGHFPFAEEPEVVAREIRSFLAMRADPRRALPEK